MEDDDDDEEENVKKEAAIYDGGLHVGSPVSPKPQCSEARSVKREMTFGSTERTHGALWFQRNRPPLAGFLLLVRYKPRRCSCSTPLLGLMYVIIWELHWDS